MYNPKESSLELQLEHLKDDECGCYVDDEGFHPCETQKEIDRLKEDEWDE